MICNCTVDHGSTTVWCCNVCGFPLKDQCWEFKPVVIKESNEITNAYKKGMVSFARIAQALIPLIISSFEDDYEFKNNLLLFQEEINKFLSEE